MAATVQMVNQRSSIKIVTAFTDEDGTAVTPTNISWTLETPAGTSINTGTEASPSATSYTKVFQDDDTDLENNNEDGLRIYTVNFTYNSNAGTGLEGKRTYQFRIRQLESIDIGG